MTPTPQNLTTGLELLDRSAQALWRAGNDLLLAQTQFGKDAALNRKLLDMYVDIDRLHAAVRDLIDEV